MAVLTPKASGAAVSSGAFRKAASFALKETAAVKIPPWAQKSWQRLEIPASNVHPTVTTLPNGLKLIVQPENVSCTVSVYGRIRNNPDMTEPRGQEGVNLVLEGLFSYGNTSLDRLAFQKTLDDIGAVESAGSDFSLQVLSDHFEPGVRLLADNVLHPALPAEGFRIVLKYFGPWEARGPKPDVLLPAVPDNQSSIVAVPNDTRVQDTVILAETLQLQRTDPDYYALELGNHVLGGGFYATRLYRDLREKTGLVYHVDVFFEVGKTRSRYIVSYACDPPKVSLAQGIIQRNLQDMQTDPVTPEEWKVAKAMALREIPLSESSLESIARGLVSRAELDLAIQEPSLAAQHYLALTADQVRAAFARRLRPADLVRVAQGPRPQ